MKRLAKVLSLVLSLMPLGLPVAAQVNPQRYAGLRWRLIGPFRGGRALTAVGIASQPDTYYFGAVGGGIWKTSDSGRTWQPVFDGQPIASIGALAVAPSDPNVIYAGTGEADMRSDITFGNGVYKSTDAGKSWRHLGLDDTRQIGRIFVDPRNPDVVLVAALGHAYGPNAERGVFRSADGGRSWQKVLFRDENTGAIDLAADPDNPQTIYASLWSARRPPWSTYQPNGGPGSGVYKSTDGGATWKELSGGGLPTGAGRIGLAVAGGTGGRRVYAVVEHSKLGGLYRSDDAGTTWSLMSADRRIHDRGWYFGTVTVDPKNRDTVFLPNVALYRSRDGGRNFEVAKGAPGGDDYHFLWINPQDPKRMVLTSDQGTVVSVNGGRTWSSWYNQPTAQFYHAATDNQFPYYVYGAQQDSGTAAVASRSDFGEITWRDWYSVGAGESGYIVPDPTDPRIVYGGDTYGTLFRFDRRTSQAQNISPAAVSEFGKPIAQRPLRFSWTSPLAFAPQDPRTLYMGSHVVLSTADGGKSWRPISPDLTGADPAARAHPQGAPTIENTRALGFGVIYTIAPSPAAAGQIWVGSDTGLIHLTRDGGRSWSNVTPPDLPAWSKISLIDASASDAATAYAAIDRHRLDDYRPFIYRTHDFGKTWKNISGGIPAPAFVRAVRQDQSRKGLLFAATELGAYFSLDDGEHWQSLQLNLPVAPIHDLVIQGNDLVVATHGRSFWILDDITPLREMREPDPGEAQLLPPSRTYRVRRSVNQDTPLPPETPAGENPPDGAILYYTLPSQPAGDIQLEIRDRKGELVRSYSSRAQPPPDEQPLRLENIWLRPPQVLPKNAGLNRFVWDLRYSPPAALVHEYPSAAAPGRTPAQPEGPPALPGKYEVRLIADGRTYAQPVEIVMDPRVATSAAELTGQFELESRIALDLNRSYGAVNEINNERKKLKVLLERNGGTGSADRKRIADSLDSRMAALAGKVDPGGEGLARIHVQLANLQPAVDSADAAPTLAQRNAFEQLHSALERELARWAELRAELAAFWKKVAAKP